MRDRLSRSWFERASIDLAPALLGCTLVRITDSGERLSGRIVETEAYAGPTDQAAHTRNGHRSARNEVMWGAAGHCYVYFTYGMHHCMNVVCGGVDIPEAVLIRALEPVDGIETMFANRAGTAGGPKGGTKPRKKPLIEKDLCSGPARFCQAMDIKMPMNGVDMTTSDRLWIEAAGSPIDTDQIINKPRIGIDSSGPEWAGKPWRWYDGESAHVSRR